jgi:hypothetical protein
MSRLAASGPPYHGFVVESQFSDIRIGDTERENAVVALGEHMSAGRLDIDEYGDRTARVATAKTRGELVALFTDLPAPQPTFAVAAPSAIGAQQPVPVASSPPVSYRIASVLVPLVALGAIGLLIAFHLWWLIFFLPGLFMMRGRMLGPSWKYRQRLAREEFRAQRRSIRRRGWYM